MPKLKVAKLVAGLGFAASLPGTALAAVLFSSDFDSVATLSPGGFQPFNAGAVVDGWTVGETSVDLVRQGHGAIDDYSIDMSGTPGPGSLWRTFKQVAGFTYTLKWDYWKNNVGDTLNVDFGQLTNQSFGPPSSVVRNQTLTFTATSNDENAVVKFSSVGAPCCGYAYAFGPTIDNVSVTAVPEPQAYGLALTGIGVVAYAMRRRHPKKN